jgi:peptidoglycan hydrolase CwlO-like protein
MLRQESQRLRSEVLSSILGRVSNDPFEKVKQLIQNLIERLLSETNSEAKKEHFCREALAKAEKDRDYRLEDAKKANVELAGLESKKDELEEEIATLTADLSDLNTTLVEATAQRKEDHENNMETIAEAKGGLDAVTEAIVILKTFYKQAANAALVQASPVDEATDGPGFSGSYKGSQESSKGIIGLLEVIKTDFQRTVSKTKTSEEEGLKMFVELERSTKADIAGKTTKKELDEEDLETTKSDIETKMDDLKTAMNLVDSALDQLEALKPTCTDFGMSYEERKEKREQEIAALKKAMCQLSPDGKIDC